MKKEIFKPRICHECTQSTEYALALDRGTAEIVAAIAKGIEIRGVVEHARQDVAPQQEVRGQINLIIPPRDRL